MNNVHFAIPEIYGETLTYYELLRKLVDKTNELIENYNTVPEQIAEEVKNLDASQLFSEVLNQLIHSIATDNTKSANAVKVYKKHDLLYAAFNETVNLYESLIDFSTGTETELIVGSNILEVNISDLFIELRKLIDINKNNIEAVTAVANENSAAITTIHDDITAIENKNTEQDNEISTLRTMISTPYNFKGDVASISALPASGAVNDTYYVQDVKYKVTWTGSAWVQSSLSEADYQTELGELKGDLDTLKDDVGIAEYSKDDLLIGKYVYKDTGLEIELSAYSVTDFIDVKNKNLCVYTNVGDDSSGLCFYDKTKQYINGFNTHEYNGKRFRPNIPNDAYYVRVSCLTSSVDGFDVTTYENSRQSFDLDILSAFTNITCCGDSLTWGQVYTSANSSRQAYKPYPSILGKRTGDNIESYAFAGYDATDWWNNYNENIIQKDNQLVIVYLGTNNGLTDTIETDAIGNDYATYADTNTGNYCKLVKKAQIVGAKVLLIKLFGSSGNYIVTNNVIDKIAEKFGVAVVENPRVINKILDEDKFHNYPDGSGVNWSHYNDLGYSAFVDELMRDVGNLSSKMMSRLIPA